MHMARYFIAVLVAWFVVLVRSESRKHYCWTGMLAPFQATHGTFLRFPYACRVDGFLPWLVSDLFLLVDLLVFISWLFR